MLPAAPFAPPTLTCSAVLAHDGGGASPPAGPPGAGGPATGASEGAGDGDRVAGCDDRGAAGVVAGTTDGAACGGALELAGIRCAPRLSACGCVPGPAHAAVITPAAAAANAAQTAGRHRAGALTCALSCVLSWENLTLGVEKSVMGAAFSHVSRLG